MDAITGLPRAASWANKPPTSVATTALQNHTNAMQSTAARQQRRTATTTRQQRSGSITGSTSTLSATTTKDRKTSTTKASSLASSSRPGLSGLVRTRSVVVVVPCARPRLLRKGSPGRLLRLALMVRPEAPDGMCDLVQHSGGGVLVPRGGSGLATSDRVRRTSVPLR